MLTKIFGDYPQVRVIDLLISHPWSEYSKSDIAEYSNISRPTLYRFFEDLLKYELIKPTKKFGNTQLYQINIASPTVKAINQFQMHLSEIEASYQINLEEEEEEEESSIEIGTEVREKINNKFIDSSNLIDKVESYFSDTFINKANFQGTKTSNSVPCAFSSNLSLNTTSLNKPKKIEIK